MVRLHNKIALVTGAGDGIGRGIAVRFAHEGARVGVFDVAGAKCGETVAMIESAGCAALALPGDVSRAADVERAVAALAKRFGPPNVLAHVAGVMPGGTIEKTSESDWDRVFAVNAKGAYLTSRAVIPSMRRAGGGTIIFMASVTGILGLPGLAAYSATKGALIALARAMSTDHAHQGIRVNAVSPGTIDSPMLHNFLVAQRDPTRLRAEFDAMHPIGRVGTVDEVAQVFVFLASDDASFVSGANYTVDGGLSVKGTQPQDDQRSEISA
jgi:NAD(P)-dependent dehydrogenase (short-subunit alcohol dehydrogenase family)